MVLKDGAGKMSYLVQFGPRCLKANLEGGAHLFAQVAGGVLGAESSEAICLLYALVRAPWPALPVVSTESEGQQTGTARVGPRAEAC